MEEYKENINTFTKQIGDKKNYIYQLEQTKRENENSTQNEQKSLEKKLFNLKQKLENEREKLKNIDKLLSLKSTTTSYAEGSQSSRTNPISISNTSAFDDHSSSSASKSTTDLMSKSFNENMFFNRSKIEVSYFDFSLSTQTETLPRKLPVTPTKTTTINASQTESVHSNSNSPLMMPKYHSVSSINYSSENLIEQSIASTSTPRSNGNNVTDNHNRSNHSNTVTRPKQKRPLTRYLPNFSLDFNLRNHILTAGHQIQSCPHVIIDGKLHDTIIQIILA